MTIPAATPAPLETKKLPLRSAGGRFRPVYLVLRDGRQVGIFGTAAGARAFVAAQAKVVA